MEGKVREPAMSHTVRGARPRHIYLSLGLQAWAPWPPPTNLSPTWNSQICPLPEPAFPGVHLMPQNLPRNKHCLCSDPRFASVASRQAPAPCTQTPACPAPRTPDPGQWAGQGRRGQAGMRPWGPGNTAAWGWCAGRGPEIRRELQEGVALREETDKGAPRGARPRRGARPQTGGGRHLISSLPHCGSRKRGCPLPLAPRS